MRSIIITSIFLFCCFYGIGAQTPGENELPSIILKISGLKHAEGKILASIFNSEETYLKEDYRTSSVPISNIDEVTIEFDNIPAGIYAASVRHDENNNGKLDLGFMRIPSEPYAFSNNARSSFGPPAFKKTQFEVKDTDVIVSIKLK